MMELQMGLRPAASLGTGDDSPQEAEEQNSGRMDELLDKRLDKRGAERGEGGA
ncbi:MAG: hypothetical protein H0X71_09570 [Rubrobacter sp.]|nr:hypothetical protein [Rubrobacter sp.]